MKDKMLARKLLQWFQMNARPLPWREKYKPYEVWVSEIMLQQTQMDRVVEYFIRWMSRFPDIYSLAGADEDEIFKYWEGLGYYNRVKNMRKTAALVAAEHGGAIPASHSVLLSLPGIGPYTAGAIMSLAFNQEYPVVDANVERVFARLFDIDSPIKNKNNRTFVWQKAKDLIPPGRARYFNQALMELGALVCLPKFPQCGHCPIVQYCRAHARGTVGERPIPGDSRKTVRIDMATVLIVDKDRIYIQKRMDKDVWGNLWEFPGGRLKQNESAEKAVVRECLEETEFVLTGLEYLATVQHSYTKYLVTLHGFIAGLKGEKSKPVLHAAQEYRWVKFEELEDFAFPAGHRKIIEMFQDGQSLLHERLVARLAGSDEC